MERVSWRGLFLAGLGFLISLGGFQSLYAGEVPQNPNERLLQEAHLKTDGTSLVAFLQMHSENFGDQEKIKQLIRQLGSKEFQEREQAAGKLFAVGPSALPLLEKGEEDADPEIGRRAKQCIEDITEHWNPGLVQAVARLILQKKPAGAEKALLAFIPHAGNDPETEMEKEVWFGLDALAKAKDKLDPIYEKTLRDKSPLRRAAAGYILARRGNSEDKAAARKLLKDPEATVRLRVAQGLLGARGKNVIPVLIELLENLSLEEAWQAEEMLHWVAGDEAPEGTIGSGYSPTVAEERKPVRPGGEAPLDRANAVLEERALFM